MGAGISIKKFSEFDYDVGMAEEYNGKGLPLSFILLGEKLG